MTSTLIEKIERNQARARGRRPPAPRFKRSGFTQSKIRKGQFAPILQVPANPVCFLCLLPRVFLLFTPEFVVLLLSIPCVLLTGVPMSDHRSCSFTPCVSLFPSPCVFITTAPAPRRARHVIASRDHTHVT